ncbi:MULTISPECIES: hypothetical protein [unclassified Sphingobium]|uniref:hypothetical protein n=1 Tax=unclassified Sphingobium TaxID=2611147 RepID=UPI002224B5F4|nr:MULTISPECIES: hypothetical protein [unclassified Sphingobium]MCW2395773.1 fucose permease [Sphingobium sp. B8D3B]MCW2419288.1 fucose permease [Sphingobium sp. B8D3C]
MSANQLQGEAFVAYQPAESQATMHGYGGLAVVVAIVAMPVWLFRSRLQGETHSPIGFPFGFDLLRRPRFGFGALSIFLCVGAEAIGDLALTLHDSRYVNL